MDASVGKICVFLVSVFSFSFAPVLFSAYYAYSLVQRLGSFFYFLSLWSVHSSFVMFTEFRYFVYLMASFVVSVLMRSALHGLA